MPKINSAKAQQAFDELSKSLSQQPVIDALQRAGKDRKLLRQAKKDPMKYLSGEGVRLPPRSDVTISELRIPTGLRLCITVCRRVGPFIFCTRICIPIIIVIG